MGVFHRMASTIFVRQIHMRICLFTPPFTGKCTHCSIPLYQTQFFSRIRKDVIAAIGNSLALGVYRILTSWNRWPVQSWAVKRSTNESFGKSRFPRRRSPFCMYVSCKLFNLGSNPLGVIIYKALFSPETYPSSSADSKLWCLGSKAFGWQVLRSQWCLDE